VVRVTPPGAELLGYSIDAAAPKRVIDGVLDKLDRYYVFPEKVKAIRAALLARNKKGAYRELIDGSSFATELTKTLQEISHDKHLSVSFSPTRLPDDLNKPGPE